MRVATDCPNYYTYHGSNNIYVKGMNPACVTWIVFPAIIPIQSCQVSYLIRVIYAKCKNDKHFKNVFIIIIFLIYLSYILTQLIL